MLVSSKVCILSVGCVLLLASSAIAAEQSSADCEIALHLAKFQGDVVNPPEKTGNFSDMLIKPQPFLTRFDLKATGVGMGEQSRFIVLYLTSAGRENLEKVTSTSIGLRMAAVQRNGEKSRVLWVWRIRSPLKSSVIAVPLENPEEAAWMSRCMNQRIGGAANEGQAAEPKGEFDF